MIPAAQLVDAQIHHRRLTNPLHHFSLSASFLWFDVDRVADVLSRHRIIRRSGWSWLGLRRSDYFRGTGCMRDVIVDEVETACRFKPEGKVYLLTQPRFCGFVFNPVSFAYCFNAEHRLEAVVAEITNTPWNERFRYVIDCRVSSTQTFPKKFHVSPFQPMHHQYEWTFIHDARSVVIHMRNLNGVTCEFEARLAGTFQSCTSQALAAMCIRRPLQTLAVLVRIYWEALRLRLKGAIFYNHPASTALH